MAVKIESTLLPQLLRLGSLLRILVSSLGLIVSEVLRQLALPRANPVQEILAQDWWVWQVGCLVVAILVHKNQWFIIVVQD